MNNHKRLKFLKSTICAGLLLGIIFSHELWFPVHRTFPRAPLAFALPEHFAAPFDWIFSAVLVISLLFIIFSRRPRVFLATTIFSILTLSFFDQLHLQPWVYQYLLLFVVFWRYDWEKADEAAVNETLGLAQVLVAGLYIWSGIQKMNYNFSHDILPSLFIPLQNLFPSIQFPFSALGIIIPLTETLIGIGLFFRKTRNFAVCFAVSMHVFVLNLLIAKNYNSIVWVWNFTLIVAGIILFWRNPVSLKKTVFNRKFTTLKSIVFAALLLPTLNFFGYWDFYLSGAYYSGNTNVPAVRISEEVFEKLLPTAKSTVFQTKTSGEKILPLFEWSIADTNAPVYLEERVFVKITREICRASSDKSQIELIIRERPAILDGKYTITRFNCEQIEKY